jgi:hypothetical protein
LWFAIGVVILGGVEWIVLTVIQHFAPGVITANIAYIVWAVFGILCLIYLLMALSGGGAPHFSLR